MCVQLQAAFMFPASAGMNRSDRPRSLPRGYVFPASAGMNRRVCFTTTSGGFSITDIVEVLTGTERPRKYWNDLKKKLFEIGYDELSEKIGQLKLIYCKKIA